MAGKIFSITQEEKRRSKEKYQALFSGAKDIATRKTQLEAKALLALGRRLPGIPGEMQYIVEQVKSGENTSVRYHHAVPKFNFDLVYEQKRYQKDLLSEYYMLNRLMKPVYEMEDNVPVRSLEAVMAEKIKAVENSQEEDPVTFIRGWMEQNDQLISAQIKILLMQTLESYRMNRSQFSANRFHINEVSSYNFAQHLFLQEPEFITQAVNTAPGVNSDFLQRIYDAIYTIVCASPPTSVVISGGYSTQKVNYGDQIEEYDYSVWNVETSVMQEQVDRSVRTIVPDMNKGRFLTERLFEILLRTFFSDLYELELRITTESEGSAIVAFQEWFYDIYHTYGYRENDIVNSVDNVNLWNTGFEEVLVIFDRLYPGAILSNQIHPEGVGYNFLPYRGHSVAFGIQLNYRQEWKPLGIQLGETIRTIPLGPKQSKKISIKTSRSLKRSTSKESSLSHEINTEVSHAAKTSDEIVRESSSKFNLETDSSISATVSFVKAGFKLSTASESANSSKDTKSRLNETMQKTASRMKSDYKISVNTETSFSQDNEETTEISNPNDDIAVTYVYSKVLQQYELHTYLNDLKNVVFVPEPIPSTKDITAAWIKKYDWIIAKALLDESFSDDLTRITGNTEDSEDYVDLEHFKRNSNNAGNAINSYNSVTTGTVNDIFSPQSALYVQQLDKKHGIHIASRLYKKAEARLCQHIRDNILHYMRAIWLSEDKEQRMLRYARISVPTVWRFEYDHPAPAVHNITVPLPGRYKADCSPVSMKRLSEIINMDGPVGFVGNCQVFYLNSQTDLANVHEALASIKSRFARYAYDIIQKNDESRLTRIYPYVCQSRFAEAEYSISFDGTDWNIKEIHEDIVLPVQFNKQSSSIFFDGITVQFLEFPFRMEFHLKIRATQFLQDPEMGVIVLNNPLPSLGYEVLFWTQSLLRMIYENIPETVRFETYIPGSTWSDCSENDKHVFRLHYHAYLLESKSTTNLVVDTDNLMLNIMVDNNVILEDFKRMHRAIDVLKESEESDMRRLENTRRQKLIDENLLDDPEIEKVIQIK